MEHADFAVTRVERRSKPRIICSCPAIIQGWNICGLKFRTSATVTNMSATGLCLDAQSEIPLGKVLFVMFRFSSTKPLNMEKASLIAVFGNVVRSTPCTQGRREIIVKIRSNRFL